MNYLLVDEDVVVLCYCLLLQYEWKTALMMAAGNGHKAVVHKLLRAEANVNEKDKVSELLTC